MSVRTFSIVAVALALVGAGCGGGDPVVVYSPHGQEMLGETEAQFEAAHPHLDMQAFDMGAKDVFSRIRAERQRPAADVWWGAPSTMFMQAAKEDLLAPYRPTWHEHVPEAFHDPDDRWYALYRSPIAILYNTNAYAASEVPQTWDALLAEPWRGRIALRKPLESGTMRTFLCAMISRAPDVDAGLAWLRELHAATASYPASPSLLFDHLKKNPERISVWLLPDIVMQRDLNGFPFGFHVPPEAPVLTDCIALVRGGGSTALAETFYEFVTSRQMLIFQAEQFGKLPARTDIAPDSLPAWMTQQQIDAMDIDWAAFSEACPGWLERWEREVYDAS